MPQKNKRKRNIAAPKATRTQDTSYLRLTEAQQLYVAVACRESGLELLDKIIGLLSHIRQEII